MRIGCVLIHNFAVQMARVTNSHLVGRPVIIGGLPFEAKGVFDASPEAVACGVLVGMPLRKAYSLCPAATFLPRDDKGYDEAFEKVISGLEHFSPIVDVETLGCAYLDVGGVQSEEILSHEIIAEISTPSGLTASVGIGSGKFPSRAAALISTREAPVIVPAGGEKDFVAPFSIDLLPCSDKTRERLHLLGLRFIGQLSQFSRESLAIQFGSGGIMLYDLVRGIDKSPLVPRKKPEVIADVTTLDPWAITWTEILQSCRTMLERILCNMKAHGKLCREILVQIRFTSGAFEEKRLPLKEATCSDAVIIGRLRTWLEGVRFAAPATEVGLSLWLVNETGRKLSLWHDHNRGEQGLSNLIRECKARFGYQPLKKLQVVDADAILPERRFRLTDV